MGLQNSFLARPFGLAQFHKGSIAFIELQVLVLAGACAAGGAAAAEDDDPMKTLRRSMQQDDRTQKQWTFAGGATGPGVQPRTAARKSLPVRAPERQNARTGLGIVSSSSAKRAISSGLW